MVHDALWLLDQAIRKRRVKVFTSGTLEMMSAWDEVKGKRPIFPSCSFSLKDKITLERVTKFIYSNKMNNKKYDHCIGCTLLRDEFCCHFKSKLSAINAVDIVFCDNNMKLTDNQEVLKARDFSNYGNHSIQDAVKGNSIFQQAAYLVRDLL